MLVGFSTYHGTVTAASDWDRPAERKRVRLVVPEGKAKEAEVLGSGPDAAGAVVDLLEQIGVA